MKPVGTGARALKRFALIRTDRIGDLILSLPVAEALKDAVPGAYVCFVVSPYNSDIARACPFVDDTIEYSEKSDRCRGFWRLVREIKSRAFDAAVFLRPTPRAAAAALLAGVPVRVGTAYRFYSPLFSRRVPEHRKHGDKHEFESNLALAASIATLKSRPYRPVIEIDAPARRYAERAMRDLDLTRKAFAIIHPGSGGSARNLTPEKYAWLADFVEDDLKVKVVMTYGNSEEGLIDRVDSVRGRQSRRLKGPPSLIELAGFIESASALVSGSTGPMHIAAAVGTPTLSFFSPVKSCSPRRWGPIAETGSVIMPPVPECLTCVGPKCKHYDCMDSVDMQAAAEAIRGLLKLPPAH